MARTEGEDRRFVSIVQNLFHFTQGVGGHDKFQKPARGFCGMIAAPGQAEAVHRHHGDGVVFHLDEAAGQNGPGQILGDGEQRAGNELSQFPLGNGDSVGELHVRQLRIVLGVIVIIFAVEPEELHQLPHLSIPPSSRGLDNLFIFINITTSYP